MPMRAPTFQPKRKRRTTEDRPSPAKRGYDHRWAEFRKATINSDPAKWLRCASCSEYQPTTTDIHLDHITPLDEGGDKYDINNLQPLCKRCHGRKTRAEHAPQRTESNAAEMRTDGAGQAATQQGAAGHALGLPSRQRGGGSGSLGGARAVPLFPTRKNLVKT